MRRESRVRRRVATLLTLLAVLVVAGCADDDAPAEPRTIAETWSLVDDACDQLGLTGIVRAEVSDPQQPPDAGLGDVEPGIALCAANAGSGFSLTVDLRVTTDVDEHASDQRRAEANLEAPSTWSSGGEVQTFPTAADPAPWAQRVETAGHTVILPSSDDDTEDARLLREVVVIEDDNLVAVIATSSTTPRSQRDAGDESARALAAATAAVPEALETAS